MAQFYHSIEEQYRSTHLSDTQHLINENEEITKTRTQVVNEKRNEQLIKMQKRRLERVAVSLMVSIFQIQFKSNQPLPTQSVLEIAKLDPTIVSDLSQKKSFVKRDFPSEQINDLPKKAVLKVVTKKIVLKDKDACAHIMTKLHEEQMTRTFHHQTVKKI